MMDKHIDEELDDFLREIDEMTQTIDDFIIATVRNVSSRDSSAKARLCESADDTSVSPEADNLLEEPQDPRLHEDRGMLLPSEREGRRLYPSGRMDGV